MIDLDNIYLKSGRDIDLAISMDEWLSLIQSKDYLVKDKLYFTDSNWRTNVFQDGINIGYISKGNNYLEYSNIISTSRRASFSIVKEILESIKLIPFIRVGGWQEVELSGDLKLELEKLNYLLDGSE